MTIATPSAAPGSGYPISFDVPYPDRLSRGLIFVKWLLALPHYVIIYALNIVFEVLSLIAFFAILFTKKYPRGLFDFNVGIRRWQANVGAYVGLLRDEYPPFSMDAGQYPLAFDVVYPEELGRFAPLYKWILAIPHFIVLAFLMIAVFFTSIIAWFAILFTGRYPEGLFNFAVGVQRWNQRVSLYALFMTDAYPPFSLNA
jgi:hypothetical protein